MSIPAKKALIHILLISLMICLSIPVALGAKGGAKGKPGGGSDPCADSNAMFPALIYATKRPDAEGGIDLMLASSDGCTKVPLPSSNRPSGHNYQLQYPVSEGLGFYAWTDHPTDGNPRSIIWRQWFSVNTDGELELTYGDTEAIYTSQGGYLRSFDLRGSGSGEILILKEGDSLLAIDNIGDCIDNPDSCTALNAQLIYSPTAGDCLSDSASAGGCYEPLNPILNLQADKLYVTFYFETSTGEENPYAYAIARFIKNSSSEWGSAEMLVGGDVFREARVESLSSNGEWLAVNYLKISKTEPSGSRTVFLDLKQCPCDPKNPILSEELSLGQSVMTWHSSWTTDDKVLMIGNEGKGRKLKHPVFELNPFTGETSILDITLDAHYNIDSNL